MSTTDRLDTLNEAQHEASDRWFAARRAYVKARAWTKETEEKKRTLDAPGSWDWSHRYDTALAALETAARAEAALRKEYLAAVDAFFAELDAPGSTP